MNANLTEFLSSKNWSLKDTIPVAGRTGEFIRYDDLPLSAASHQFLAGRFPVGIYRHQHEALRLLLDGINVCLCTSTGSGKSMPSYAHALHLLSTSPKNRVLAIYPLKALGTEQTSRWKEALSNLAPNSDVVGRIDGSIPVRDRIALLRKHRIIVMTPDVIHAWLLPNVAEREVKAFLAGLSLVMVDEVHEYAGVFGSNAAFLFRRLRHLLDLCGARPRFLAASATIADPGRHLMDLIGVPFEVINGNSDTSPRHPLDIHFLQPPQGSDLIKSLTEMLGFIADKTDHRFLAFVNSRKMAEQVAAATARGSSKTLSRNSLVPDFSVLPYRAGYEEADRKAIQDRLANGSLSGVISTSALELGIDIPSLTMGILVGVPPSSTSFHQRIGRIGRHQPGEILVVNAGDLPSEDIFRDPSSLFRMPPVQSTLYLGNDRLQYIHTLCIARQGGEHDQLAGTSDGEVLGGIGTAVDWPEGFLEMCQNERAGNVPVELRSMKLEAGQDPNLIFPLRDAEMQFQVVRRFHGVEERLGCLSHAQVMREAYPGAIYRYITRPFRVIRVRMSDRKVEVREERKQYFTRPINLPTNIYPDFTSSEMQSPRAYRDLIVGEFDLQVRETIAGFKERRGSNEESRTYPLNGESGLYYDKQRFSRNFFTTGVLITHPALNAPGVRVDILSNLLFEAFLMLVPLEKSDVQFGADKYRQNFGPFCAAQRFVAIYDQTYGSLRLSSRLLNEDILRRVLAKAMELALSGSVEEMTDETLVAIRLMNKACKHSPEELCCAPLGKPGVDQKRFIQVICPKSKAADVDNDLEEFLVDGVFFSPVSNGLMYRAVPTRPRTGTAVVIRSIPINRLREIPGVTRFALYDLEMGELRPLADAETA